MSTNVVDDNLDLPSLNQLFEKSDPARVVEWAGATFGDGLVMSSSFGAESALLLHMATRVKPNIKVIYVNTGYLFPETHAFMEQLRLRLNLNVWIYRTRNDPIAWLRTHGEPDPSYRNDVNACCAANKNEPFDRAMKELAPKAWLRGIRRNQAATRADRQFIEWTSRSNCYAVSPLLNWTSREIYGYMKAHDLPFHPLMDKGYLSIGCNPKTCTQPITAGDDPRAGRWAGQAKVECGINMTGSMDSAKI
jgi:phosphoadenosine phosphosulfate reductase